MPTKYELAQEMTPLTRKNSLRRLFWTGRVVVFGEDAQKGSFAESDIIPEATRIGRIGLACIRRFDTDFYEDAKDWVDGNYKLKRKMKASKHVVFPAKNR